MANGYTFGDKLQGIGAVLGGTVPQFQKQMGELSAERQKAMYQDADAALKMATRGDLPGVISLIEDRINMIQRLNGDPTESLQALNFARAAQSGDVAAGDKLMQGLTMSQKRGIDLGFIAPPAAPERIIVGEGQTVMEVGSDGQMRPVATGAPKQKSPTTEIGKLQYDLNNNVITQAQYDEQVRLIEEGQDRATFEEESKLRKEFNAIPQVKSFSEQSQAYGRIIASAADPSPAGDLALIFNYMKVLDPGSTVREGEFANAQNAGSIPARIGALYNNVVEGERLTEGQRKDFVDRAKGLYEDAENGFMKRYRQFETLAKTQNLIPENVLSDYRYDVQESQMQQQNTFATKQQFDEALPDLPAGIYSYIDVNESGKPELVTVEVGE
jgi:hypothetical protein